MQPGLRANKDFMTAMNATGQMAPKTISYN
jgi:hypothetical protein